LRGTHTKTSFSEIEISSNAVFPYALRTKTPLPFSAKMRAAPKLSFLIAACRGVSPSKLTFVSSAPFINKKSAKSASSTIAAAWSGVFPDASVSFISYFDWKRLFASFPLPLKINATTDLSFGVDAHPNIKKQKINAGTYVIIFLIIVFSPEFNYREKTGDD